MAVFENMMSDLYFHEESDYSGENTCGNKVLLSNILQPFHESEQKKRVVMGAMRKELSIYTLQLPIYYILE